MSHSQIGVVPSWFSGTFRNRLHPMPENTSDYPLTKVSDTSFIEGYWKNSTSPGYPFPKATDTKVEEQFLTILTHIMNTYPCNYYRGLSTCRLCKKMNGCGEYRIKKMVDGKEITFVFPEGLKHYYQDHNVQPSKEFYDFIKGFQEELEKPEQVNTNYDPLTVKSSSVYIEGYWRNDVNDSEDKLPFPKPTKKPVNPDFISKLEKIFKELDETKSTPSPNGMVLYYEGFSTCRLCECEYHNGTREYHISGGILDWRKITFIVPEGILHYYKNHHVQPSDQFFRFVSAYVLDSEREAKKKQDEEDKEPDFFTKLGYGGGNGKYF